MITGLGLIGTGLAPSLMLQAASFALMLPVLPVVLTSAG